MKPEDYKKLGYQELLTILEQSGWYNAAVIQETLNRLGKKVEDFGSQEQANVYAATMLVLLGKYGMILKP